jgi:O-antigen/teichoic acid export membrane protein
MQIGRRDIYWNYLATFLRIASSALLFPFILRMMPSETVGMWTIFTTITAFGGLLDMGFNSSFARNVTYVFSGVRSLKVKGYESITDENKTIDYGLLKGVISAMRWFYFRIALVLFIFLATVGTYYVHTLLNGYHSSHREVYMAWIILCLISTYNLFTLYYDALLQGKGLVKRSKQITIIGQGVYLVIAACLILFGFGLIAIVSAQASSVLIIRWLSYRAFFTKETRQNLNAATSRSVKDVLKVIAPNALKIGFTSIGGFLVQKSSTIIGSLFLTLSEIASYNITITLIGVIAGLAGIYTGTYQPKIAQLRVENNNDKIKELYLRGQVVLLLTYFAGGVVLTFFGEWALQLIGSKTQLMPPLIIAVATLISFLESNHGIAGNILLSKNEVPFFKAALLSGAGSVLLLFLFFNLTKMQLWAMVLAPGTAQFVYQNWKWPLEVHRELGIKRKDLSVLRHSFRTWIKF